jgi:hypothetical protein
MPRVVPSDVVKVADRMFGDMVKSPKAFPAIGPDAIPRLVAFADLVDAVPAELLRLDPEEYAAVLSCVAYMRSMDRAFQGGHRAVNFNLVAYDLNPVALIRAAMAKCPDEAPAPDTVELPFVTDEGLRESIRLDISGANSDLIEGQWKGATVLAGSAVEALLLWALQERQKAQPQDVAAAIAAVLKQNPGTDLEGPGWHLHQYVEVAAYLKLIRGDTPKLVRLAKDARNLVHPGAAARRQETCDRATALVALAAVEAVARDLK